ncbi:MAG: pirin family protein [Wenzhouxiangellaceae bacterium]|nr:pirin family protein [Wenzhouxiangellaceae bacterium]
MTERELAHTIPATATSDGAGVRLRRSIGTARGIDVDPFLMLDEFSSDDPDDYIAGFPNHPHRGFETVTYMLDGHMLHQDHMGNRGDLGPGGVQWMTAGRGIIHSEMPQQQNGRMRGFQLWINLPAAEKMKPAAYRDIPAADIPEIRPSGGGTVRLIAGQLSIDDERYSGAINTAGGMSTDPLYADIVLAPGQAFSAPVSASHRAIIYLYEGAARIGNPSEAVGNERQMLQPHSAGVLGNGDRISIRAGQNGCRALLLAGKAIGEPVVQYGPFVMNSRAEIEQAIRDYQSGRLTAEPSLRQSS